MHETETADDFQTLVNTALPTLVREAAISESGKLYRSVMARVERPLLRQALDLAGGNQLKAARLLGINRNTLRKRLRLLGLLQMPGGNGQNAEKGPSASLAPSAARSTHRRVRLACGRRAPPRIWTFLSILRVFPHPAGQLRERRTRLV